MSMSEAFESIKRGLQEAIAHAEGQEDSMTHESDTYTWAKEQAALLRAGRLEALDVANLIEELDAMGARERRELVNRLVVLLVHLLKWQHQPDRRGASWARTIRVQRMDIAELLEDSPGLRPVLAESFARAYRKARLLAANETGLSEEAFPTVLTLTVANALDPDFLPD